MPISFLPENFFRFKEDDEYGPEKNVIDFFADFDPSQDDIEEIKEEQNFQNWYKNYAKEFGLDSNPDNPEHHYDYRAAYKSGLGPDKTGHWDSRFKSLDHPNRFVNGVDTREGSSTLEYLRNLKDEYDISPPGAGELSLIDKAFGLGKRGVDWLGSKASGLGQTVPIEELAKSALIPETHSEPLISAFKDPRVRGLSKIIPGANLLTLKEDIEAIGEKAPSLRAPLTGLARGVVGTAARLGLDPTVALSLPVVGSALGPYFAVHGARGGGEAIGRGLHHFDSGDSSKGVESFVEGFGDIGLSVAGAYHPVAKAGERLAQNYPSLNKEISLPSMESTPSSQRGAVGNIGDLNRFEDRMYEKYGPEFRTKLNEIEGAVHGVLLKNKPSAEVDLTDPYSVERDLLESGAMTPEELSINVPKGMEKLAKKNPGIVGPSARIGKIEPEITLSPEDVSVEGVLEEPGIPPGVIGAMERAYEDAGYSDALEIARAMRISENDALDAAGQIEKSYMTGDQPVDVSPISKYLPIEEEGIGEPIDAEIISGHPSRESIKLIDEISKAQNLEEINKEILPGGLKDTANMIDKIEKAQAVEERFKQKKEERSTAQSYREIVNLQKKLEKAQGTEERLNIRNQIQKEKDIFRLQQKIEKAQAVEELNLRKTPKQEIKESRGILRQVAGGSKSILSSYDISFPGRQGFFFLNRAPGRSGMIKGTKAIFSEKTYNEGIKDIESRPNHELYKRFGLDTELRSEEAFPIPELVEKIPGSKQSSRGFNLSASLTRANMFDHFSEQWSKKGFTPETQPDLYKATARYVNTLTGRGELSAKLNKASEIANDFFWSPRMVKARLDILNPNYFRKLPKELKVAYLRDVVGTLAVAQGTLALTAYALSQAGVDADYEPNPIKSNFGQLKIGKAHIAMFGGLQSYIRLASRLLTGRQVSMGEKKTRVMGMTGGPVLDKLGLQDPAPEPSKISKTGSAAGLLEQFGRGKLAPVPGGIYSLLKEEDFIGRPYGPGEFAKDIISPMALREIIEGSSVGETEAILAALGLLGPDVYVEAPRKLKKNSSKKAASSDFVGLY